MSSTTKNGEQDFGHERSKRLESAVQFGNFYISFLESLAEGSVNPQKINDQLRQIPEKWQKIISEGLQSLEGAVIKNESLRKILLHTLKLKDTDSNNVFFHLLTLGEQQRRNGADINPEEFARVCAPFVTVKPDDLGVQHVVFSEELTEELDKRGIFVGRQSFLSAFPVQNNDHYLYIVDLEKDDALARKEARHHEIHHFMYRSLTGLGEVKRSTEQGIEAEVFDNFRDEFSAYTISLFIRNDYRYTNLKTESFVNTILRKKLKQQPKLNSKIDRALYVAQDTADYAIARNINITALILPALLSKNFEDFEKRLRGFQDEFRNAKKKPQETDKKRNIIQRLFKRD